MERKNKTLEGGGREKKTHTERGKKKNGPIIFLLFVGDKKEISKHTEYNNLFDET